jgi:hypothetical protein
LNGRIALSLDDFLAFLADPRNIAAYPLDGLAANRRNGDENQGNHQKYFPNHLPRSPSLLRTGKTLFTSLNSLVFFLFNSPEDFSQPT